MESAGYDLIPRLPPRPVLARTWPAWVVSAIAVIVTQVEMWNGWNRSGEWVPVTGTTALSSYVVYGVASAIPVAAALWLLRRWLSLSALLLALVYFGASTGQFLETSESSTAGFAWFAPLFYGPPIVVVVWLAESAFRTPRG